MPLEIPDLIKQFSKNPGCALYANPGSQLALIIDYVWLWQLTPSLPFETFLEKYAAVADHDEKNLKHPADAMQELCPRTQASAARTGRPQWTAAQLADFTMLYIDMIRAADEEKVPVPLPFSTFLKNLGPQYLAGTFPPKPTPLFDNAAAAEAALAAGTPLPSSNHVPPVAAAAAAPAPAPAPAPTAAPRQRGRKAAAAATPPAPAPSTLQPGQQVIYTNSQGRQRVGTTEAVETDPVSKRTYVTFSDVDGERFEGLSVESVRPAVPADGPFPAAPVGPRVATARLTIPRAVYPSVAAVLGLKTPCGTVPVGAVIYPFEAAFDPAVAPGVVAHVDVNNGEAGPYVDAYLVDAQGNTFADVPPRENLVGSYSFKTDRGIFDLVVASRGVDGDQLAPGLTPGRAQAGVATNTQTVLNTAVPITHLG